MSWELYLKGVTSIVAYEPETSTAMYYNEYKREYFVTARWLEDKLGYRRLCCFGMVSGRCIYKIDNEHLILLNRLAERAIYMRRVKVKSDVPLSELRDEGYVGPVCEVCECELGY